MSVKSFGTHVPKMLIGKFLFEGKKKEKNVFGFVADILAKFFDMTKEEKLNKYNVKVA